MRRTVLLTSALVCFAVLLAAGAPAVEVTVKANTTLYGPDGKAVANVAAGQRFDATRLRGEWVWGSIKTEHGAAEGWIKLIALAMDDETKQKLADQSAPTTTQTGADDGSISVTAQGAGQAAGGPVVLRYKLPLNELQLYEGLQEIKVELNVPGLEGAIEESILVQASLRGKGIDADAAMRGELAFHGFRYKRTTTMNGATTRLEGDANGATLFQGDTQVATGKWGSSKLGEVPDFAKRLNAKCPLSVTDRGKIEFGAAAKKLGSFDLEQMLGGPCVYPEKAVARGDSWTIEIDEAFGVEGLEDTAIPLTGQIKYTVLGRVVHRQRPCLKLGIEGVFEEGEMPAGLQLTADLKGTTIVDIATGIKLDTDVLLTLNMAGSVTGSQMQVNGTARFRTAYRGNKLN